MFQRRSRSLLAAVLFVLAVGVGSAAVWSLSREEAVVSQEEAVASEEPAAANCGSLSVPELTGEVNTLLDKERGLLTLFFSDGSGSERAITVRYREPACLENQALRRVIDHARDVDARAQAQICAAMRTAVERNVTQVRGRRVNNDAGRRYLAEWC